MLKFYRMLALLAGLASSVASAQTCPTFAAGDKNYIAKLNQLSAGCAPVGGGTPGSPLTTKGDLWTYTTTNARLAVGTNNYILTANSGTSTGLEWKNAINGVTIGATTPATGAFTSLTASSTAAFSSTVSLGASSYLYFEQRSAPSSPPSGAMAAWADATSNTLKTEDGDGNFSTTVVPNTGASNNFLTAISADGVVSRAQPSVSNLSGFGTGVATALGNNTNSSGGVVTGGAITSSGLTMATSRLLGRTTASTGAVEEISVGSGLTLSGGSLAATGGGGVTEKDYVTDTSAPTSAATSSATATVIAQGTSQTYAGSKVKLEYQCPAITTSANGSVILEFWRDSTSLGRSYQALFGTAAPLHAHMTQYDTPSAGSHTYSVRAWGSGAGTITCNNNSVFAPSFIRVIEGG